jgi:RHS repeat-associated protein
MGTNGSVLDQITYGTFGGLLSETNSANGDRFKYAGGEYDTVLGSYRFKARYFGPADGRFFSQDPLGLVADTNPYRYVDNYPIDSTDPSGLLAMLQDPMDPAVDAGRPRWNPYGPSNSAQANDAIGRTVNAIDRFFAGWGYALAGQGFLNARERIWGYEATHNHHGTEFDWGLRAGKLHAGAIAVAGGVQAVQGIGGIMGGGLVAGADGTLAVAPALAGNGVLAAEGAAAAIVGGRAYMTAPNPPGGGGGVPSGPTWRLGSNHSAQEWANKMAQRGWTPQQITDAMANGQRFPAPNNINPANGATRYVNPTTGRSVIVDNVTGEVIHVGGDGFLY